LRPDTLNERFARSKAEVLASLSAVAEVAALAGSHSLAARLRDERIPRLRDERFHLVVVGEYNHGKTTFVNALLGTPVLPSGVTPTTAVIHHLVHGESRRVEVVDSHGERRPIGVEQLGDLVVGGRSRRDDVAYVEVHWPSPFLASGLVLVDTPGVNDLNLARAEITYGYIPRADAVLFVLDAGQVLKESERSFLEQKLLAASRDKVIFVVNKVDQLTPSERDEALTYVRRNLSRIFPEARVYPVSAQRALAGDLAGSGLPELVAYLGIYLSEERGRIMLDNALDEGLRAAALLTRSLEVQRHAMTMERADLDRRLAALEADVDGAGDRQLAREQRIRERIAVTRALVRREHEDFAERFAQALPAEILRSQANDLKTYLPGFIEDRFRAFAERQSEQVARTLEQIAEEAIAFLEADARARAAAVADALGPGAPRLDLRVDTFAYDVGVFALGAFGLTLMALSNVLLGGALTVAAPLLAWVLRLRADARLREQAAEQAPRVVREAACRMADALDARIAEFGAQIVAFVRAASEEQTRSVLEVLQSVRSAREAGEDRARAVEARAASSLGRLGELVASMEAQRRALWGGQSEGDPAASSAGTPVGSSA
jgi:small GTP-binding protein